MGTYTHFYDGQMALFITLTMRSYCLCLHLKDKHWLLADNLVPISTSMNKINFEWNWYFKINFEVMLFTFEYFYHKS